MTTLQIGKRTSGPYTIVHTHVNGTVTIELQPGVNEWLNIWHIKPYREDTYH